MMQAFFTLIFLLPLTVRAVDLPNPLTLGNTLQLAKNQNLDERQQQINIELNGVILDEYQDVYKPKIDLDMQLARRAYDNTGVDNSHAFIKINQVLFDQNTSINQSIAESDIQSTRFKLQQIKDNKTVELMRGFFDVVLADMRYETILEKLAISAIQEGRVRDDFDTQDASEVELLEKQAQTQLDIGERIEAEAEQIVTRAKLAQLLNIAYEDRPDDLTKPKLDHFLKKELGEFEVWQKKVLAQNPILQDMKRTLLNLKQQSSKESNNSEIIVSSNIRLGEQAYQRDKNGKWRVGLNLVMPIGQSYKQKRKISELYLKIKQQQLSIKQFSQSLNQEALSLWLRLRALSQKYKATIIELDYRDLYLERSRANYEMEIKSDIGNAMVNLTDTEWKLAKSEFNYIITLTKLKQLAGEDYEL